MACMSLSAYALEYESGNNSFKLTGYGTIGMINPDIETPLFIGDWRVRGQFTNSDINNTQFGLVYALDQAALDKGNFSRETFVFLQSKKFEKGYLQNAFKAFEEYYHLSNQHTYDEP